DFNSNPYMWLDSVVPIVPNSATTGFDQAEVLDDYMRASGFDTPTVDSGPTRESIGLGLRLDSIYSRELSVLASAVERGIDVSDHLPLWIDVATPTPSESAQSLSAEPR
ncbi:MAG: hypothetical protein AAGC55_11410, partial [Myxococcota bacterium]